MTRSDLIARLAARHHHLVLKDVGVAVIASLASGERTEIRGFGAFAVSHRPARTGRTPKTAEKVAVSEKYAPHFKPGRELRERVDR